LFYLVAIISNWYSGKAKVTSTSLSNECCQILESCFCMKRKKSLRRRVGATSTDDSKGNKSKAMHNKVTIADKNQAGKSTVIEISSKPRPAQISGHQEMNLQSALAVDDGKSNTSESEELHIDHTTSNQNDHLTVDVPGCNLARASTASRVDLADHRSLVSYTNYHENRMDDKNKTADLDHIDSTGRVIGHRGKPKPPKHKNTDNEEAESKANANRVEPVNQYEDEQTYRQLSTQRMDITSAITMRSDSERVAHILDAMSGSDLDSPPINVIVFELSNVLCTNVEKLQDRLEGYVESMTQTQKELCFGGADRLQMVAAFLKEIHQSHGSAKDAVKLKCFVVANESSKMIVRLLKDTNLLKYFVSRNPENNKFLSHVIGFDHKIAKESANKKHLMMLKLLQFLQRSHDELLYIGHDKQVTEHLRQIKICKTYWCQSKGLTQSALDEIQEMRLSS